jgi:hypothetical protein
MRERRGVLADAPPIFRMEPLRDFRLAFSARTISHPAARRRASA